jgi:hypothetical protein
MGNQISLSMPAISGEFLPHKGLTPDQTLPKQGGVFCVGCVWFPTISGGAYENN